jgi:hypothetical protein
MQLLPALLSQTFTGFSAPFDAGRQFFSIDIIAAFPAFDAGFIGKYLNFTSAARAFIETDL